MKRTLFPLIFIFILVACTFKSPFPNGGDGLLQGYFPHSGTVTLTPFQPVIEQHTTTPEATPAPTEELPHFLVGIYLPDYLPFTPQLPDNLTLVSSPETAEYGLEVGDDLPVTRWVYALVAPFPTLTDGITLAEVKAAWNGNGPGLLMSGKTLGVFTAWWGTPASGAVQEVPEDQLVDAAWAQRDVWAFVPFEALNPRWKVLAVDGQSPLEKTFNLDTYPLTVPFSWVGEAVLQGLVPSTNRDPNKLTVVAMTGVTALVRATAFTMEQQGILYPARDIGDWLRNADITHISNEVPFARDCPFPNPVQEGVVFCSDTRYLQLLENVGTDVVELTGDHFHDWGAEAMLYTLGLYAEVGWPVYGGGATFELGKQPAFLEDHGNRFAFIGCNGKGGSFSQASATSPGSVHCDFPWLEGEIAQLKAEGYIVIATFQHFEYYSYDIPDTTKEDFRRLARAGAVVVSGSQAHQPHGFEFVGDSSDTSLLHFGLGNLFFDQYGMSPATEQAFVDYHVFYDGQYLGTELLTMKFEDYARARPMTVAERVDLLLATFGASGW
ncbi:MAG: CapA family protein [Anaerolineales bacterium]|nr:CapA family protein [Anaerolineales bacterium]